METFERRGIAILREIAQDDLKRVKHFGRVSLDAPCKQYDNLVAAGDPNESLLRFRMLRQSFFDFPALDIQDVFEHQATAIVSWVGWRRKPRPTKRWASSNDYWNVPAVHRSRSLYRPAPGSAIRGHGSRWRGGRRTARAEKASSLSYREDADEALTSTRAVVSMRKPKQIICERELPTVHASHWPLQRTIRLASVV